MAAPFVLTRRAILEGVFGAFVVQGCSSREDGDAALPIDACAIEAGRLGARIPFLDEGQQALEVPVGEGHDGRLYTDLTKLSDASSLVIDNARFYVRTNKPDRIDDTKPWTIRVGGVGFASDREWSIAEVAALASEETRTTLLECSGNARGGSFGLMSVARWRGALVERVLDRIGASALAATARISISGFDDDSHPSTHSTPGASWIFTRDQLVRARAFFALEMNGAPLPGPHGAPIRLVVPNWYGCSCIKWVNEIRVVGDDEPSTAQMIEFASRTHQTGEPALARDYQPAEIDLAAMPTRVFRIVDRDRSVLVAGVYWGGPNIPAALAPPLEIRAGNLAPRAVQVCVPRGSTESWGLWSVVLDGVASGATYDVRLRSLDASLRTRRLDTGFYARSFTMP